MVSQDLGMLELAAAASEIEIETLEEVVEVERVTSEEDTGK